MYWTNDGVEYDENLFRQKRQEQKADCDTRRIPHAGSRKQRFGQREHQPARRNGTDASDQRVHASPPVRNTGEAAISAIDTAATSVSISTCSASPSPRKRSAYGFPESGSPTADAIRSAHRVKNTVSTGFAHRSRISTAPPTPSVFLTNSRH